MTQSLKTLGLLVATACAFGALLAPAASAQDFTAGSYPATLSGSQVGGHVFTIENGLTVECPTAVFSGELDAQADEIAGVSAKYGNEEAKCTFSVIKATVKMNGCTYTFVDEANVSSGMEHEGSAEIVCPEGKKITIATGNCEVQVGPQTGLGPVHYLIDTAPNPDILTVITTIENEIEYTKTTDDLFCPLQGTGTKTDGSYESTTEVDADSSGPVSLGLTP